jgi:hypothetical protein
MRKIVVCIAQAGYEDALGKLNTATDLLHADEDLEEPFDDPEPIEVEIIGANLSTNPQTTVN